MEDTLLLKAADTFLLHGGLEYVPTNELLSTFGSASREFKKQARREFNCRLRRCHPSLVAAVGPTNIDSIGWKEWRRFELGERKSRNGGESWRVLATDLADIDVLLEVKKEDGSVVWHGCMPLERGEMWRGYHQCPEIIFTLPHMSFNAPKPCEDEYHKFESPDHRFPGLTTYHYWCGRSDRSLQQKTICKAIYGINSKPLLQVHVVLRRRSNGKMVTLLSTTQPNQIMGEDYGHDVGDYHLAYCNRYNLFDDDDDDRVDAEIFFSLFCSDETDETQQSIRFHTSTSELECLDNDDSESSESEEHMDEEENNENNEPESEEHSDEEEELANVAFRFTICDEEPDEDCEGLILRAMRSWKWG